MVFDGPAAKFDQPALSRIYNVNPDDLLPPPNLLRHKGPGEGPWGGGRPILRGGALSSPRVPTQSGTIAATTRCTKGECKPAVIQCMSGADLS